MKEFIPKLVDSNHYHLWTDVLHDGKEHISEILSPDSDPEPAMKELLSKILIPISAIRAYQGNSLISERKLNMRGT